MRVSKKYMVVVAVILFVILLAGWFFFDELLAREKAAFQSTLDWDRWRERIPPGRDEYELLSGDPTFPLELRPTVLLRTDTSGEKVLIRHTYSDDVYSYEPESRSVEKVGVSNWTAGNSEITNCYEQVERGWEQSYRLNVETDGYPKYLATINKQKINAHGRRILYVKLSPDNSKLAVLSASGWLKGPGIGFIGLGGADPKIIGQRYLQIYDLRSKAFVGSPILVGGKLGDANYAMCWSQDEKFVLVYNWYREFHIVSASQ